MIIKDGVRYYNSREIADIIGVSNQTIVNWDKWSYLRVEEGLDRLIPECVRMCGNKRHWDEDDVVKIMGFLTKRPTKFADKWTNTEYVPVPK